VAMFVSHHLGETLHAHDGNDRHLNFRTPACCDGKAHRLARSGT
jgi:hypothetical protein